MSRIVYALRTNAIPSSSGVVSIGPRGTHDPARVYLKDSIVRVEIDNMDAIENKVDHDG